MGSKSTRSWLWLAALALALAACQADQEHQPGKNRSDTQPGGLFDGFLDGKFDTFGHPLGSQVFEAEAVCTTMNGSPEAEGWGAWPGEHGAGTLCQVPVASPARGALMLNLRALTQELAAGAADDPVVLTLRALDASGKQLGRLEVRASRFLEAMTYQNLTLGFANRTTGALTLEVSWSGERPVRLDYLELFRSTRRLVLDPPSGVLTAETILQAHLINPPTGAGLRLRCGEQDVTPRLEELLGSGAAERQSSDFDEVNRAPAASLLQGCPLPARLGAEVVQDEMVRVQSRISFYAKEPPCTFAPAKTRVLLTGFEPFPASSKGENSSERAVLGFDAGALPGISVMRLILPVEWDTAAAMVGRTIARCQPHVVISFGQGRSAVDLETTAYNLQDSSDLAGGLPDNRGVVKEAEAISGEGPQELRTGLPVEAIQSALLQAGINVNLSNDPGRYICNNVFYELMRRASASGLVGGFVHLPRMPTVNEAGAAQLQRVVQEVVVKSAAAASSGS